MSLFDLSRGSSSIQGARENQEDYSGQSVTDYYALGYICDGHNGRQCADTLGSTFAQTMQEAVQELAPTAHHGDISNAMLKCYWAAVEGSEKCFGGSTLSAYCLQLSTGILAVLQLGDSKIGLADLESGQVIVQTPLAHYDQAYPDAQLPLRHSVCVTRSHGFKDQGEQARYRQELSKIGQEMVVKRHAHAHQMEDRWLCHLGSQSLPEPSRAVEPAQQALQFLPSDLRQVVFDLQRSPEVVVWQCPTNQTSFVFCVCDGFESKLAIPDGNRIAMLLSNPARYIKSPNLMKDTIVNSICGQKSGQIANMTASQKIEVIKSTVYGSLPDEMWRRAYEISYNHVIEKLSAGNFPELKDDPEAVVQFATHVAVLMLSDDNVSSEILVIIPK
jgi:hypothetical protein